MLGGRRGGGRGEWWDSAMVSLVGRLGGGVYCMHMYISVSKVTGVCLQRL